MNDRIQPADSAAASAPRVDLEDAPMSDLLQELRAAWRASELRDVPDNELGASVRAAGRDMTAPQRAGLYLVVQATLMGLIAPEVADLGTWRETAQEALRLVSGHDRALALRLVRAAA
jgi:hypothetical protein